MAVITISRNFASGDRELGRYLRLSGDFDGGSAHELINTLTKHGTGFWDIFIDTNNLKTIHPFARNVFQKNLSSIKKQLNNLIIVGIMKYKIAPN